MIRAIIFDFFGVFRTDPYKKWLQAQGLQQEGAYAEAARQQDMGLLTVRQFLERLSELQGRPITLEELEGHVRVDAAMVALASSLKQRYRTALLSNAPAAFIRDLLTVHDLERLFDEIVVSSEVQLVKPSAEIFRLVLQKLGVPASEAIFIDDNEGHTQAAAVLGIRSLHFTSVEQLTRDLQAIGVA